MGDFLGSYLWGTGDEEDVTEDADLYPSKPISVVDIRNLEKKGNASRPDLEVPLPEGGDSDDEFPPASVRSMSALGSPPPSRTDTASAAAAAGEDDFAPVSVASMSALSMPKTPAGSDDVISVASTPHSHTPPSLFSIPLSRKPGYFASHEVISTQTQADGANEEPERPAGPSEVADLIQAPITPVSASLLVKRAFKSFRRIRTQFSPRIVPKKGGMEENKHENDHW